MRSMLFITPVAVLLAGGAAFAQSGQGGYLGVNAAKDQMTASQESVKPPPQQGSGQGGYLGANAGAAQPAATQAPPPAHGSGQGGYLGQAPGTSR